MNEPKIAHRTKRNITDGNRLSKIWLYTKFQLITKSVLGLVVIPIYALAVHFLLRSSGKFHISSGDYIEFLFSYQGALTLVITMFLLSVMVALDINTFIISSALIHEGHIRPSSREVIIQGLKKAKNFFKPSGFFILLYIALIIPLVGIGLTISATEDFQIPNFITDVIFNNALYTTLYILLLTVLAVVSLVYIFTFHYIILLEKTTRESLKLARLLMKKHWRKFIKDFLLLFLFYSLLASIVTGILFSAFFLMTELLTIPLALKRMSIAFFLLLSAEFFSFLTLLTVPLITSRLTTLFYRYNENDGIQIAYSQNFQIKTEKKRRFRLAPLLAISLFSVLLLLFNLLSSAVIGFNFDSLFLNHSHIDIVAHRGGGDLGAENTLQGLEGAIAAGANCSEIDVQRTKDGFYIIHHDTTFSRLSGVPQKSHEMDCDEIRKLKVKNLFQPDAESQKIATLEEFMNASKGRIVLYIELKGKTADQKMVDDVVNLIKEKDMEDETAILSLDYNLIEYTEKKYPEITTGYLYFFHVGEIDKLAGDILIMEEREASPEKIEKIHKSGKKAVVWTVNKEESISKFVRSNVDGIITDYVLKVRRGIEERDARSDYEILIDALLGK